MEKFNIVLHKSPSESTPNELAAALMMAATLTETKKLGIDLEKVHLILEFKSTSHVVCLSLTKGQGSGDGPLFSKDACRN